MRNEKEIKEEIKKIETRMQFHREELEVEHPSLFKSFATQCYSKIVALQWVLNEKEEASKKE